jgi:GxxExxY protein
MDLVVNESMVVELKTAERLLAIHEAQLLTYLRLSGLNLGLLLSFAAPVLRDGIKRMVLNRPEFS